MDDFFHHRHSHVFAVDNNTSSFYRFRRRDRPIHPTKLAVRTESRILCWVIQCQQHYICDKQVSN